MAKRASVCPRDLRHMSPMPLQWGSPQGSYKEKRPCPENVLSCVRLRVMASTCLTGLPWQKCGSIGAHDVMRPWVIPLLTWNTVSKQSPYLSILLLETLPEIIVLSWSLALKSSPKEEVFWIYMWLPNFLILNILIGYFGLFCNILHALLSWEPIVKQESGKNVSLHKELATIPSQRLRGFSPAHRGGQPQAPLSEQNLPCQAPCEESTPEMPFEDGWQPQKEKGSEDRHAQLSPRFICQVGLSHHGKASAEAVCHDGPFHTHTQTPQAAVSRVTSCFVVEMLLLLPQWKVWGPFIGFLGLYPLNISIF